MLFAPSYEPLLRVAEWTREVALCRTGDVIYASDVDGEGRVVAILDFAQRYTPTPGEEITSYIVHRSWASGIVAVDDQAVDNTSGACIIFPRYADKGVVKFAFDAATTGARGYGPSPWATGLAIPRIVATVQGRSVL